jgi:putative transposase
MGFVLDTFNNEIIASALAARPGDPRSYFKCLDQHYHKRKGIHQPSTIHTDQGAVYSCIAFQQALVDYNITPSISRVGTPTDNQIIEAVNGWGRASFIPLGRFKNNHNLRKSSNNIPTILIIKDPPMPYNSKPPFNLNGIRD